MMDLSFRWPHPRYSSAIGSLSFRLHTFDNAFGIDPDQVTVTSESGGTLVAESRGLVWAGGQKTADGRIRAVLTPTRAGVSVMLTGEHADGVRSLGITLHDQPAQGVTEMREREIRVPETGRLVSYPNGWYELATPFFGIGDSLVVRSLDDRPRPKRIAFLPHFDNPALMDVEMLIEQEATTPSDTFEAPAWIIEPAADRAAARAAHREHVHASYAPDSWETRTDVPEWARQVSLVLTLHGKHFTGRTFLDYDAILSAIRSVAQRIDGKRILAYLPGWEGRYYRWYGRYDVDPDLGGEDGFRRLVEEAQQLGVHVMPMFGANVAARDLPGFERWGEPAIVRSASGLSRAGTVDWDASRHFDHGSLARLNPAYAPWRAHLVAQIASLYERFPFDATFLDITAMYSNDPNGSPTDGLRNLIDEIHAQLPGHLIAGEGWFDAIGGVVPLVQTGHLDTVPVFHDLPDEDLFAATNRSFGHVSLGDPASGSSGVHEAGYVKAWRLPVRKAVIPTIGIVEDTLAAAPDRVAQLIEDAHEYAARYLTP